MVGLRRESPVAGPGVGHPDDAEIPLIAHGDVVKWPQRRDNPKFDPSVDLCVKKIPEWRDTEWFDFSFSDPLTVGQRSWHERARIKLITIEMCRSHATESRRLPTRPACARDLLAGHVE